MGQNLGRVLKLDDPKANLEIDRLFQILQQQQLTSRNMDLAEVATAIAKTIKDGQLLVLTRLLAAPLDLPENATPQNPPANTARLFARDNGAGKTQLCVIFPSGGVQTLATEP